MAINKFALARYALIDKLLRRHRYVKTSYIVEFCKENLNCNITQRTIQLDILAMQNDSFIGYYAPIEYCKKQKAYYYKDPEYQLIPFQFSQAEIELIQKILYLVKNIISEEEYGILINFNAKIQFLHK